MRKISWLVMPLVGLACASQTGDPSDTQAGGEEIVGGSVDTGHPYVVGVGNASGAFCSGTLISKRTVITAGHCFGGITRVYFGNKTSTATKVAVAKKVIHPAYAEADDEATNDVAVLQLAADAPAGVHPAPLLRQTMNNSPTFVGPPFVFVGFGNNNGVNQTGFGTKRKVSFPIVAVGPADLPADSTISNDDIDASMFYYATPNKNTCNGDSGGPAFFVQNGVEFHAGVTSFGDGPCLEDGVQGRTDKPVIDAFIQARINEFEPNNACRNDGTCNESCNTGGFVKDPDCAAAHCGADGLCSQACVSDPDCGGGGGSGGAGGTGGTGGSGGTGGTGGTAGSGGSVGGPNSCVGKCGNFTAGAACQCDAQCAQFGDCCADKAQVCNLAERRARRRPLPPRADRRRGAVLCEGGCLVVVCRAKASARLQRRLGETGLSEGGSRGPKNW